MSFQWTFIAGYLYFEVAIVIILMLPIASPRRWDRFFKSRLFALFQSHAAWYFYVLMMILSLFLVDAIKDMRKYSHSTEGGHVHLASELKVNVKLFRAQRNFYITGFAIFLAFVIRRLVTMILLQAQLLDKSADIIREAEAAKNLAKETVIAHRLQADDQSNKSVDELREKIKTLEELRVKDRLRIQELEEEAAVWRSQCVIMYDGDNAEE